MKKFLTRLVEDVIGFILMSLVKAALALSNLYSKLRK